MHLKPLGRINDRPSYRISNLLQVFLQRKFVRVGLVHILGEYKVYIRFLILQDKTDPAASFIP